MTTVTTAVVAANIRCVTRIADIPEQWRIQGAEEGGMPPPPLTAKISVFLLVQQAAKLLKWHLD